MTMAAREVSSATGPARSARTGPPELVVDALDYGRRIILQGAPIPWEPIEHVRFLGQIAALLRPDRTLIDAGRLVDILLADRPGLREAMSARSRTGYALRTLLADEQVAATAVELTRIAAASGARPIVVRIPSPGIWLARTAAVAGVEGAADADDRENASVYVADWLRRFADVGVRAVLLDGRGAAEPESIEDYPPLRGVCEHYRWDLLLNRDGDVESTGPQAASLSATWWSAATGAAPDADLLIADIPAQAVAEVVLERRAALV